MARNIWNELLIGETDLNECESGPCQNNGECIDLIGRYQCRCAGTGFEGVNCKFFSDQISYFATNTSFLIFWPKKYRPKLTKNVSNEIINK